MTTVGVVAPLDYLFIYGGAVQRIKADVAALIDSGYNVEMICPSRIRQPHPDLPSGLTLVTYRNVQHATFLGKRTLLSSFLEDIIKEFQHHLYSFR